MAFEKSVKALRDFKKLKDEERKEARRNLGLSKSGDLEPPKSANTLRVDSISPPITPRRRDILS